ncbi:leucine-rich repeat receptor-like tyrosine-protein kinase PXC3 [Oryza brachyantha]|uniref:non-specific serine/threonine protein kinase n=1 Tax=Oryza brachyantha TaxID=4533 RepID=J3NBW6_ORYBR|nr:leucine-rich repeat receptor-like tyrosine-protein kinase PXC3 [Oryza brachyantha]
MEERSSCSCSSSGFLLQLVLALFLSLFLFLDSSMAATAAPPSAPLNTTQASIMKELIAMVPNSAWWNTSDSNPCRWDGVNCSSSNSLSVVTNLTLSGYGLSNSSIFETICSLDNLQFLDLSKNSFINLSPRFFTSSCSMKAGLRSLNLSSNSILMPLGDFSGFPLLEVLDLSFNSFSGSISTQLNSLPKMRSLNLSGNSLVGDVPTSMALSLEELVLSSNQFSGSIPKALFNYRNLTMLDLSQNNLTGDVPDEFLKLPKLRTLILSANNLSGNIPGSVSNVISLSRFAANQNYFTGLIPSGITKNVKMLDLSYNNISGVIPSDMLSPVGLQSVDLTGNNLEGPIPRNLSSTLYRLRLGDNSLNGTIPNTIGDALALAYLELDSNHLMGSIPLELGKCKNLFLLNLGSNELKGPVPDAIGSLDKLVVLKLQMNSLDGPIPSAFFGLANLNTMNLSQNSFTGELPREISKLSKKTKLSVLNLQGNKISGSIPNSISLLTSLIELSLGNNALTGIIPTMPIKLSAVLNLSHNHLSGSIPSNIGLLSDLEVLDLSYNDLSGEVPASLASMQSLTQLVLSYNNLSGSIPIFPGHVEVTDTGNPGLKNGTGDNGKDTTSGKRTHGIFITVVAIAGALVGLCLLGAILMVSYSKRIYRVEDEGSSTEEAVARIINGHLITMNSIHTSAIDFSKAMEAVSNHNNIFLKTRFCTYYKAVMPNGSTYSVKRLNWSDKIFQIGNQQKFGNELEVLGKLSNSNVMVPLAYVLTEENAYILYEHMHKGTVFDFLHAGMSDVLDWPSRYSIAFGLAQGLTFLHGCTQPVLLLDLSTRTVHLKSMNEPQIGDIELSKIVDPSKSSGSLSTIAGTVGYIPPEYAYTMRLTMAGNVYSFGVILLELLTGKPSVCDGIELAKWALSLSGSPDQREQILDSRVSRTSAAVHSQMLSVLNIALACVALSPDARPKMRSVLRMLLNAK